MNYITRVVHKDRDGHDATLQLFRKIKIKIKKLRLKLKKLKLLKLDIMIMTMKFPNANTFQNKENQQLKKLLKIKYNDSDN